VRLRGFRRGRTLGTQVTAASQTVLKLLPPGITPPYVLSYNASSVPILQLALSSQALPQMKLFELGQNFIRPQLATVQGAAVPSPYGGKILQVQVDLDQQAMQSHNVSAEDVVNAVNDEANATYRGFRQSLHSLDIAIDAARQATKIASERYDRGLTDFLNVLDAERKQFALEAQRAEVVRLAGDSFVVLYKAIGGGWPPDEIIPPIRHPDPAAIAAVKHLIWDPPHSLPPPPPPGLTP
jgi:hypothetical protein